MGSGMPSSQRIAPLPNPMMVLLKSLVLRWCENAHARAQFHAASPSSAHDGIRARQRRKNRRPAFSLR